MPLTFTRFVARPSPGASPIPETGDSGDSGDELVAETEITS